MANKFEIRCLRRNEMIAVERLTDQEGWDVSSLTDGFDIDPKGWVVAVTESGDIIGLCAAVSLNDNLAMVAFFLVDKNYRGQGIGGKLWKTSISRHEGKNILLSAISIDLYTKHGFFTGQEVQSWSCKISPQTFSPAISHPECHFQICDIKDVPLHRIGEYDQKIAPYNRSEFFENYIIKGGSSGAVAIDKISGDILGYGILKKGRLSWKLTPIYAECDEVALKLMQTLLTSVSEGDTVSLLPFTENTSAISMLKENGFTPTLSVTSMYNRYPILVPTKKIFSVAGVDCTVF